VGWEASCLLHLSGFGSSGSLTDGQSSSEDQAEAGKGRDGWKKETCCMNIEREWF